MLKFAHSSSKVLDIGDLRVALINYIIAKKDNDNFITIIEDIENEQNRNSDKSAENIDILKKFAIDTEQTIYQTQNKKIYQNFALKLLQEGKAFVCFCSQEKLDKNYSCNQKCLNLTQEEISKLKDSKKSFVIRVKKPESNIEFTDTIYGNISKTPEDIDSFIILDSNTNPTKIFSKAIDNMILNITKIIDNYSNINDVAKEIYIHKLLGYDNNIKYSHLPNIKNSDLITIKSLFQDGFLPDAIINYILLLSSNKIDKEIFYLPEIIKNFDLNNINKKISSFDIEELKTINKKHLQAMDSKKLSKIFGFADSDIGELAKLYLKDFSTINELDSKIKAIFSPKNCKDKNMQLLAKTIQEAPMIDSFEEFKSYLLENSNLKENEICEYLKILLTNNENETVNIEQIYKLIKPYLLEVARCH